MLLNHERFLLDKKKMYLYLVTHSEQVHLIRCDHDIILEENECFKTCLAVFKILCMEFILLESIF